MLPSISAKGHHQVPRGVLVEEVEDEDGEERSAGW